MLYGSKLFPIITNHRYPERGRRHIPFFGRPLRSGRSREYFETPHNVDIERLVEVHRFKVYRATDAPSLESALSEFYQPGQQAAVLIIQTPEKINGKILKGYFQTLKN